MAYNTSNNNQSQIFHPNVYGRVVVNTKSDIAKSSLSFTMWKSTIRITISKMINESADGKLAQFDQKNGSSIYLTTNKAYMLAALIEKFIEDPDKYNGYGVASTKAVLRLFKEGEDSVITIDTFSNNGLTPGNKYVINKENAAVVTGVDNNQCIYDYNLFQNLDFQTIITQLKEYYKAMTNSIAFTVMDANAYNNDFIRKSLSGGSRPIGNIETANKSKFATTVDDEDDDFLS